MLTLFETAEAIKALQTEPDIIQQACEKVLGLDKVKDMDAGALAKQIIFDYVTKVGSTKLLAALVQAVGQLAAMKVRPGKEDELLISLSEAIRHEMYSFQAFEKQLRAAVPAELLDEMAKAFAKTVRGFPK